MNAQKANTTADLEERDSPLFLWIKYFLMLWGLWQKPGCIFSPLQLQKLYQKLFPQHIKWKQPKPVQFQIPEGQELQHVTNT